MERKGECIPCLKDGLGLIFPFIYLLFFYTQESHTPINAVSYILKHKR